MPKLFGREVSTPVIAIATVLTAFLAYSRLMPSDEPAAAPAKKKSTTASKANSIFQKEDFTAQFASYNTAPRNAFEPLIIRANTSGGGGVNAKEKEAPGSLITSLTGGEANWYFTGTVEVNGRTQALLENTSTGDAVYLSPGDRFKAATLSSISSESVTFSGAAGPVVVKRADPSERKGGSNVTATGGVAPLNPGPALRGQIGGGIAGLPGNGTNPNAAAQGVPGGQNPGMQPFDNMMVQPDNGDNGFNGRGRRRGGGGGRRGRGGGGGGFPQQ